jgi:hypothetical protein
MVVNFKYQCVALGSDLCNDEVPNPQIKKEQKCKIKFLVLEIKKLVVSQRSHIMVSLKSVAKFNKYSFKNTNSFLFNYQKLK